MLRYSKVVAQLAHVYTAKLYYIHNIRSYKFILSNKVFSFYIACHYSRNAENEFNIGAIDKIGTELIATSSHRVKCKKYDVTDRRGIFEKCI